MTNIAQSIYRGNDPRDLPAYEIVEAARYLQVPYFTLNNWFRPITVETDRGYSARPLIQRPPNSRKMSFRNLVEAHVVKAISLHHKIPVPEIRRAIEYAEKKEQIPNLLTHEKLQIGAGQLFVEKFGELISLGRGGQLAMKKVLEKYLQRIEYDEEWAVRFYPFIQGYDSTAVSISPRVSFGKPIVGGITTYMIAERFELGEEEDVIATDYGISRQDVEQAIIYEAG